MVDLARRCVANFEIKYKYFFNFNCWGLDFDTPKLVLFLVFFSFLKVSNQKLKTSFGLACNLASLRNVFDFILKKKHLRRRTIFFCRDSFTEV